VQSLSDLSTTDYVTILSVAFLSSVALAPIVRAWAVRHELVDRPDQLRRLHSKATALGGGLVVFGATVAGVGTCLLGSQYHRVLDIGAEWFGLLAASAIVCTFGLIDDRCQLRGRQKLAGQFIAVAVLVHQGIVMREAQLLNWRVELGLLAVPFTMFWLIGAVNALNLLDGADGFASTVGIVVSGAIALLAGLTNHWFDACLATALCGALTGFLVFNFPPASIFLGDSGSTLLGLLIGTLAIRSGLEPSGTVVLAVPLALLSIPIFDSAAAIARRWLTGRSLYETDRNHLHHCLLRRGIGPKGLLLVATVLCAATGAGAVLTVLKQNDFYALAASAGTLAVLVGSRVLGYTELVLFTKRAGRFCRSLMRLPSTDATAIPDICVHLQGAWNWDEMWHTLIQFAEQHALDSVRLNINVAWLHEGFHASWVSRKSAADRVWHTRLPLVAKDRVLGHLDLVGPSNNGSVSASLHAVAELLDSIEPSILGLSDQSPPADFRHQTRFEEFPVQPYGDRPRALESVLEHGQDDPSERVHLRSATEPHKPR